MERGRSPSSGHAHSIRHPHSASTSPHPPLNASFAGSQNISAHDNSFKSLNPQGFSTAAFSDPSFTQDYSQQAKWSLDPTFNTGYQQEQSGQSQISPSQRLSDTTNHQAFLQTSNLASQDYSQNGQGSNHVSPSALNQNNLPFSQDTSAFPSFDFNQPDYDLSRSSFDGGASLDPQLLSGLDAGSLDPLSVNPLSSNLAVSQDQMAATMQSHTPTPPHNLYPDMTRRQSGSPSPHATPGFAQNGFQQQMGRPRNVSESLDPASAMFPQGQNEWPSRAYGGHRRQHSDNISELSSHSAQASPYLATLDSFDQNPTTPPTMHPAQDAVFNGDLGLQGFSISEGQMQQPYISPNHSGYPSPQPQIQQLPPFTADNHYGLAATMNGQFTQQANGLDLFPNVAQDPFPALNHTSPGEGAADQMSPPEINIDYAPPTRNPMENMRAGTHADDTLSPPLRSQSRNRMRAKSDSHAGSRPTSPFMPGRVRSPSLQPQTSDPGELLAPINDRKNSRSPSPGRGRAGSHGSRQRSTSHASDQRDYILDLADPDRSPSNGADKGRIQKHPATFQCHLCPKRFTRAYNLRSHLRTHTDERPFVCTVCGKAFARQHDRKRHEGLHSGEKKFVCKGNLTSGAHWGCGRRFARADALGRHFRSEAGRVCIKPLLDEEAAERQRAWMEEQQQAQVAAGLVAPQPMLDQPHMDLNNFLPAALLQQYPALAGIDWSSVPQDPPIDEEYSGRSSFDAGASSGGEYYDDGSENEMGGYPDPGMTGLNNINTMTTMSIMNGFGVNMGQGQRQAQGGAQQQQHQGFGGGGGMYHNQAGDYLSDFEGR
ncbi:DNA-binding transcription factor [Recurvomyces mirabilis]|uniref:DNA-binding transcription factor n=1 Tax=Recurvomyces mirabilis TaxID=574656 RepID=A0AAE0WLE0_9PEZI|nr:DNA-binding transcription factor [Recurvomyces mirabilis]KAK5152282.1 DNA-binding transcription factor [Recurvomyces mirabilis]